MHKLLLSLIAVILLFSSCKNDQEAEMLSRDWTFKNEANVYLIQKTSQDTLKRIDVELADTDYSIQLGMMYRDELTENQGMLFLFDQAFQRSFYMKNTPIPLDIIYITASKHVDSYALNAQPKDETLLTSKGSVQYVLEVKAGMVQKWNLQEGDRIDWNITEK